MDPRLHYHSLFGIQKNRRPAQDSFMVIPSDSKVPVCDFKVQPITLSYLENRLTVGVAVLGVSLLFSMQFLGSTVI